MFGHDSTDRPDEQPMNSAADRPAVPADLELRQLYERFREPLDDGLALSAAPEAVRDWLGRYLWRAMIAGRPVEGAALDALAKEGFRCDQVELVRKFYRERMRPRISEDELRQIRRLLAAQTRGNGGGAV